ncbi:hypothetical protein F4778DRAFT_734605 [Xylariomycetidae sp. FL2044]|nr:hypothetical protein F4778DRAFT_734605 [Xylariomycetidae sp. FL2044]
MMLDLLRSSGLGVQNSKLTLSTCLTPTSLTSLVWNRNAENDVVPVLGDGYCLSTQIRAAANPLVEYDQGFQHQLARQEFNSHFQTNGREQLVLGILSDPPDPWDPYRAGIVGALTYVRIANEGEVDARAVTCADFTFPRGNYHQAISNGYSEAAQTSLQRRFRRSIKKIVRDNGPIFLIRSLSSDSRYATTKGVMLDYVHTRANIERHPVVVYLDSTEDPDAQLYMNHGYRVYNQGQPQKKDTDVKVRVVMADGVEEYGEEHEEEKYKWEAWIR